MNAGILELAAGFFLWMLTLGNEQRIPSVDASTIELAASIFLMYRHSIGSN